MLVRYRPLPAVPIHTGPRWRIGLDVPSRPIVIRLSIGSGLDTDGESSRSASTDIVIRATNSEWGRRAATPDLATLTVFGRLGMSH